MLGSSISDLEKQPSWQIPGGDSQGHLLVSKSQRQTSAVPLGSCHTVHISLEEISLKVTITKLLLSEYYKCNVSGINNTALTVKL